MIFQRHIKLWLALALLLIAAGCGASLWVTPLSALPRYRLAHERYNLYWKVVRG